MFFLANGPIEDPERRVRPARPIVGPASRLAASAASPRRASADPRRRHDTPPRIRGVATTRLRGISTRHHGIFTWHPRRRRDAPPCGTRGGRRDPERGKRQIEPPAVSRLATRIPRLKSSSLTPSDSSRVVAPYASPSESGTSSESAPPPAPPPAIVARWRTAVVLVLGRNLIVDSAPRRAASSR